MFLFTVVLAPPTALPQNFVPWGLTCVCRRPGSLSHWVRQDLRELRK